MANQLATFQSLKPMIRPALVAMAFVILFGRPDGPAAQLVALLSTAARQTLVLLPSFVLNAWQAFEPHTIGHQQFSLCGLGALVFWPLLETVTSAA